MFGSVSVYPAELPVATLLALATDPKGTKAKMEELAAAVKEANKATIEASKAVTDAEQKKASAVKALAEL